MIRDRIKRFDRVKASAIEPHPKNWRTHCDAQRTALRGLLEEIGIADACIVRQLSRGRYQLIDGHLRREELADAKIPVLVLDVTAKEAEKLLTTLDPLAAIAGTDKEKLARLIDATQLKNADAAAFLSDVAKRFDVADVAAAAGTTQVRFEAQAGDAYREQYGVIVICTDESHQQQTYEALSKAGHNCRVVTT